jgi:toxin ParE1/3/4
MKRFVLHPEAYTDLDEVWEYIASDNVDAADRTREEIYDAIGKLVPFPIRATSGPISPLALCAFRRCETT